MNRRFFVTGGAALVAGSATSLGALFRMAENTPAAADTLPATDKAPRQACVLSIEQPGSDIEKAIANVRSLLDIITPADQYNSFEDYITGIGARYIELFGENSVEYEDEFMHALETFSYEEFKYVEARDVLMLFPRDGSQKLAGFSLEHQKIICDATMSFSNLVLGQLPTLSNYLGVTAPAEHALKAIELYVGALEQNMGAPSCGAPSFPVEEKRPKPAVPTVGMQVRYA